MRILLLCCLIPLFFACEKKQDEPSKVNEPSSVSEPAEIPVPERTFTPLLQQGIEPVVVELASEALASWRPAGGAGEKPTLLLLSNDPFLRPVPQPLVAEVVHLAQSGSRDQLRVRGTALSPDPLLLPSMAVSAALQSGFFSRLVWVLPLVPEAQLDLEILRRQLVEYGAMSEDEASALVFESGAVVGRMHGVPLQIVPLAGLTSLAEPVLLHIDLSYFQPIYKGEIKTPLYPLLLQTLIHLRDLQLNVGEVTLSLSHLEGNLPLDTRFIGGTLAEIFRQPGFLDGGGPRHWDDRGQTLYLANFFQKERIRDLLLKMEQNDPADASVKFALYQVLRQFKEGTAALDALGQAVALDPVYAREYIELVTVANDNGRPDEALRMLERAAEVFAGNPFIRLEQAELLLHAGRNAEAVALIKQLQSLDWSSVYYPDLPQRMQQMLETPEAK